MKITAKDVAALRQKTGCGMMDCKKALVEANGDFEEAVKVLRERGLAVAAKKADRIAAEGLVDIMISEDGKTAAMIEVNTETDFVAKNETFREFVQNLLKTVLKVRPADVDALLKAPFVEGDVTVEEALKDKIFTIGENLNIRRFVIVDGVFSSYVHGKGVTGIIISFDADENVVAHPEFPEMAKNIALQAAAIPSVYVSREDVPESVVAEEKNILTSQIMQDPKNANKPANIIEKMVTGRMGKFYEANCLLEQAYVKDDSVTVDQYIKASAKSFGGNIKVTACYRYEKGEGLARREENFAEEIAKMVNQ
ncbi:MAG: elongation factor Ts [Clostridiales bacterium]|nr:elongation factor Ts [Clostridiales bacterium]